MAWEPDLPPGRHVELPGRGTTFVRELSGPSDDAPVVVLLHGWTVTADLNWFPSYRSLARTHRVITLDHRGHGRGLRGFGRFRLADAADDVAALCAVLGIESAVVCGYSMGGPIAMLTWHRHRELVDGLVLCATAPMFRRSGVGEWIGRALPVMATVGRWTPPAVREFVASRLLGRRLLDDAFGAWARTQIALGDPVSVAEAGAALGRFDNRDWLADIAVPTAVVRTTADPVVPPSRQSILVESIPGARAFDVAVDHGGCVGAAEVFVPALVDAVTDVSARATAPA